jgi:hypothetical protein
LHAHIQGISYLLGLGVKPENLVTKNILLIPKVSMDIIANYFWSPIVEKQAAHN